MQYSVISKKIAQKLNLSGYHQTPQVFPEKLPLIAIVGSPNVGKSVLFNALTGVYVTVSNYPGTTVEVTRGKGRFDNNELNVMDTPGMYGLLPITEEERVARGILLHEHPSVVIHVLDAKNIERMLPMTLQLIEAGLPVILVVNLMDEAERIGVQIDLGAIGQALGIPVIGAAFTLGRGTVEVKSCLADMLASQNSCSQCQPKKEIFKIHYSAPIQEAIQKIEDSLTVSYDLSKREIAILLLQNDPEVLDLVQQQETADKASQVTQILQSVQAGFNQPLQFLIARQQREAAQKILRSAAELPSRRPNTFATRLSEFMIRPITGVPILLVTLFLIYEFVGVFGSQILVNLLETKLFGNLINPAVNQALNWLIPWAVLRDLFGGQFGIITLGFRYAVAIVLPIVGTFFLTFSVIEDSGYLPRLAMLIDRVFKRIGLNGRAVIPIVLGFGCDTMATIVTRTLETKRERVLSTLLLSLAIPCSAQLGVMLGLLNGRPDLLAIWMLMIGGVFLFVGFLAAKLMPGERPTFYMELPPLRMPTLRNVLVKTYTRMEWYLREVFPLFILASILIWLGRLTGLFDLAVNALVPLVHFIGLPDQTATAFLFGFFRRDYGAAGLFDMRASMTAHQLLVATVTMTLFMPCIAQFAVTIKERGWKTALGIAVFIFPFALLVGGALNWVLTLFGGI
jgi:ferrous iron transport protein B